MDARCVYWVGSDTTGHRCEAEAVTSRHCAKHYPIALRRLQRDAERRRASHARTEAAWQERNRRNLPQWRVQLERAEAEYARRTSSPTADRAAVGGDTHRSIVRAQARHLSDSNVTRVVELEQLIARIRSDITRMEGTAQHDG